MTDYNELLNLPEYYTLTDLRYNGKLSLNMSTSEIAEFLSFKDEQIAENSPTFTRLNLVPFNSRFMFYANHNSLKELFDEYIQLVNSDGVFDSNLEEMRKSRIYSEVEGSLNIEGYNSTRLIFEKLMSGKAPENKNEVIIRNMANALRFTEKALPFTKDNLFTLYSLISEDCLDEEQKLKTGDFYRYDMVYISSYNGAPVDKLDECMDSLFEFVSNGVKSTDRLFRFLLPHIVHYYLVYMHPYFDCNGRTARMASLWISNLTGIGNSPYFISEAINDRKAEYYRALSRTRDSRNDLTYFLQFILKTSIDYALCYRKMNIYRERLSLSGDSMTPAEFGYMKKIILSFADRYFTWKDFIAATATDMTKQGALKTLNRLESEGLVESGLNRKNEKIFRICNE